MFRNARNLILTGGTYVEHHHGPSHGTEMLLVKALQSLIEAMAPNALYDSDARFDPPKCHPHTRSSIFEHLHKCVRGEVNSDTHITWLYGPAGAGKSAILQKMAEECAAQGRLLASFFYWKSDPTRNHPKGFVATLCYQIIQQITPIREFVLQVVQHDPLIFTKTLQVQMQRLIVEPMGRLVSTGFFNDDTPKASLILIDGVDECVDHAQRHLFLHSIAYLVVNIQAPITCFISSRPEHDITHVFSSQQMSGLWMSCALDYNYETYIDILQFLRDSFREIVLTHPYKHCLPPCWPDDDDVESLAKKSSGQFIYASVVVKYVSALASLPHRRLQVALGLVAAPTSDMPFVQLDAIYIHLLKSHRNSTAALSIISCIVAGIGGVKSIAALLSLETGDVELEMGPLASIITREHDKFSISHASFMDFLFDQTRSKEFFLGTFQQCEIQTARHCVAYLNSNQKYNRNNFFLYLLNSLSDETQRTHEVDLAWHQILDDLQFDKAFPMDDVRDFYRCYWARKGRENDVWDHVWQPKFMLELRKKLDVYLSSRPLTTALVCHAVFPLRSSLLNYLPRMTPLQKAFNESAFFVNDGRDQIWDTSAVIRMLFGSAVPNHLSLLRQHFDVTVMALLQSLSKQHFYYTTLHIKSLCNSCQSRTYSGIRARSVRQWRVRRIYRNAGVALYKYKIPYQHNDPAMQWALESLPCLLKCCSTSPGMISFVRLHVGHICVAHPARQQVLRDIQHYLSCKRDGRMPDEEIDLRQRLESRIYFFS